jgi:hypothetical protein
MFAVLYAYVLHSYAMNQFGEEIYRKPQLSAEHPFWNGYAWAVYPKKKFPTGVLFMPIKGNQYYFVSAAGVPRLDLKQTTAFLKDVSPDGKVDNPELRNSLSEFGLIDDGGNLTIPVFEPEWSEKLEDMAKTVYAKTIEIAKSEEMKNILGMATLPQAAMYLHYEMRYAFLDYLLDQEIIEAPVDFKNASANSSNDLRKLVFLMKTKR